MATKYKEIFKELELIPEDKKTDLLKSKAKKSALVEIDDFAIETGIKDLAENYKSYLD